LKSLSLHKVAADLTNKQDHGRGILIGRMNTDRGIGRPGSSGYKANTWLPSQLAMGLRHVGCATFVTTDHQIDLSLSVVQGIQDRQVTLTWYAVDSLHTLRQQGLNH
jgi:hypothetical protein